MTVSLCHIHFLSHVAQTLTALYLNDNPISVKGVQSFADVLKENRVMTLTSICILLNFECIQKINTLDICYDKTGLEEAQQLAMDLKNNQVTFIPSFIISTLYNSKQMITSLNLCQNHIGDEGTVYLANVLKNNQVIFVLFSFVFIFLLILYRKSLLSTWHRIKSVIKVFIVSNMS